jgi:high-affinity Fe2+/Pb2+ permease
MNEHLEWALSVIFVVAFSILDGYLVVRLVSALGIKNDESAGLLMIALFVLVWIAFAQLVRLTVYIFTSTGGRRR